jgi:hypothetical protein
MSKSPSLRRIQADIRELALDPSDRYHASPLEDDMFEWYVRVEHEEGEREREKEKELRSSIPPVQVLLPVQTETESERRYFDTFFFADPLVLFLLPQALYHSWS